MSDRTQLTQVDPCAFSAIMVGYTGDPEEADLLTRAGRLLLAGRGEGHRPTVEPELAAASRVRALAEECAALADWCRDEDLVLDYLAADEQAAAYLYQARCVAGRALRMLCRRLEDALEDTEGKAARWMAERVEGPRTELGRTLAGLAGDVRLLLEDVAALERQAAGRVPEQDEDLLHRGAVQVAGALGATREELAAAVRDLGQAVEGAEEEGGAA